MARSARRATFPWRAALGYGAILAAGAMLLQWLELRFAARAYPVETGIALLALGCVALGVWVGRALTARPRPPEFTRNVAAIAELGLTPRECQILDRLAQGEATKEIARALGISPNTAKTHLAHLYAKLGVARRMQAIEEARRLSLIP